MTDLQKEENARIIFSHYRVKREFVQHDGSTIADMMQMVEKRMEVCGVCNGEKTVTFTTLGNGENAWTEPCTHCNATGVEPACQHDWRGMDTGRMCSKCLTTEGAR